MGRERFFHTKYSEILDDTKRKITCGIEIETYLTNKKDKLIVDNEITDELLSVLPESITKDYYPYQLEIRTKPYSNPKDLLVELKENIEKCHKEATKRDLNIHFNSWLGRDEMFNGLHFHIRNDKDNPFLNTIINSYPLVLSIASFFRCSPGGFNLPSRRLDSSPHCGIPNLDGYNLAKSNNGNRYRDMSINQAKDNNRHRMKSVNTLELRMFDVPCNWDYTKLLVNLLFEVFVRVKTKKTLFDEKDKDGANKYYETASITRDELCSCRHTFNYFLNDFNDNVVIKLCKIFGLKPIEENLVTFVDEDPLNYDIYQGFPFLVKPASYKKKEKEKLSDEKSCADIVTRHSNELFNEMSETILERRRDSEEYRPTMEVDTGVDVSRDSTASPPTPRPIRNSSEPITWYSGDQDHPTSTEN